MATKADLEAALSNLQTAVTSKIGEASASVEAARAQLTTVQATLDTFVSEDRLEDAAYEARITDLQRQLADAVSGLGDAVVSINAVTASVQGAGTTPAPEA